MLLGRIGARQGHRALLTPVARTFVRRLQNDSQVRPGVESVPEDAVDPRKVESNILRREEALARKRELLASTGSVVEKEYDPRWLYQSPPTPQDVSLEALMASQTHMGHHRSLWNPSNSRYIYGIRNGIHIISLESTAAHLRRAAKVVEEVAYRAGLILFVGTRPGQRLIVTTAAALSGACHLFNKWVPGSITNRDIILANKEMKVVNEEDKALPGFDRHILNTRPVVPDLVVCLNPVENYTLLYECGLGSIPTIGVIDTDADPSWVTYTIPANDDSLRSISFIAGVLGQAAKQGKDRRFKDLQEQNLVTWHTPNDVKKYMQKLRKRLPEINNTILDKTMRYNAADAGTKAEDEENMDDDNLRWEAESEEELARLAKEMGWDKPQNSLVLEGDEDDDEAREARETAAFEAAERFMEDDAFADADEGVEAEEEDVEPVLKETDELAKEAEAKVLRELAAGPEGETEAELNERIMKSVHIEKGLDVETGESGAAGEATKDAPTPADKKP